MKVFYWDLSRLDEWNARQTFECSHCAQVLSAANGETLFLHLLRHVHGAEERRGLKTLLYLYRNWERLPEEVRRAYLASVVHRIHQDPAKFEELQREEVVKQL
jgi:hypothetical protein